MALVVRRAFTPKNLTLLRCFKGRSHHITTAAIKRDPAFLANVTPLRSFARKESLDRFPLKIDEATTLNRKVLRTSTLPKLRISVSCPNLTTRSTRSSLVPFHQRSFSTTAVNRSRRNVLDPTVQLPFATRRYTKKANPGVEHGKTSLTRDLDEGQAAPRDRLFGITVRSQSSCCPCPSPCSSSACPAACLPPPCQTAPRCVQYMTGYYYYPYGWWFCGPYHNTACAPCGPCCPDQLRCGGSVGPCCVVPSALAATTTLTAGFDPSGFNDTKTTNYDWSRVQNPMYPQTNPATPGPGLDPGFQPSFQPSRQPSYQPSFQPSFNPSYGTPPSPGPNLPLFKPTKSGVSKFFSVNPALNVSPAAPSNKWPPLNQPPSFSGPKKQPGSSMSTLCSQRPVADRQNYEIESITSAYPSYHKERTAEVERQGLPWSRKYMRTWTRHSATTLEARDKENTPVASSKTMVPTPSMFKKTSFSTQTPPKKKLSLLSLLIG